MEKQLPNRGNTRATCGDAKSQRLKTRRMAFVWREWRGLIVFLAVVIAVRMIIVDWNHVPSRSMVPTIIRVTVSLSKAGLRAANSF